MADTSGRARTAVRFGDEELASRRALPVPPDVFSVRLLLNSFPASKKSLCLFIVTGLQAKSSSREK